MMTLNQISRSFGATEVLNNITLTVKDKSVNIIMGSSGSGKTTLLNIISGIDTNFHGTIENRPDNISYIFQEDRLLNWKTLIGNINLVLKGKNISPERIDHILSLLNISDLKHKPVSELSGGQRQRVAIARAFLYPSDLILMDEPFSSLDMVLKYSIISDLQQLISEEKRTIILVTHDIKESYLLGDIVHILSGKPATIHKTVSLSTAKTNRKEYSDEMMSFEKDVWEVISNEFKSVRLKKES